jgi:hypothetical protein
VDVVFVSLLHTVNGALDSAKEKSMRRNWIVRIVTMTVLTANVMAHADEGEPEEQAVASHQSGQEGQESADNLATIVAQWTSDRNADKESDPVTYLQRILAIAQRRPTSDEGCDAALWIVAKRPGRPALKGPITVIEREAIGLLVTHHANNLRVLSVECPELLFQVL